MSTTLSNRYQPLDQLGETPFSTVYCALDTHLERRLALHWLTRRDEPFLRELTAWFKQMGQLRHPAIAQVVDFDLEHEPPYFLLELGTEPPQAIDDITELGALLAAFVPVARGLAYAHRQGVWHGQLHRRSVLYKRHAEIDAQLFITDLGLPGWHGEEEIPERLWPYLAPEQWRGDTAVAASDVYSLGVLLYELVTGTRPFVGERAEQMAGLHLQRQPPPAHTVRNDIPLEVSALLGEMLSKETAGRPAMLEVAERLDALAKQFAYIVPEGDRLHISVTFTDPTSGAPQQEQFVFADEVTVLHIGSEEACEVRLAGPAILARHVRLQKSAGQWLAEDLGSEQGTFLQGRRLVVGRAEAWLEGAQLQVGGYQVRWYREWSTEDTAVLRETDTAVQVHLAPEAQSVMAGERCFFEIELVNQSAAVTHCALQVAGVPSHWVSLSGQMLPLMPQAHATVQLTVQPPRNHTALAQTYAFQILLAVTGQKAAREAAAGELSVHPYIALQSSIQPQQLVNEGVCYLTVINEGNAPAQLTTTGRDAPGRLVYENLPAAVPLLPGTSQTFAVQVRNPRRPWVGTQQTTLFVLTNTLALAMEPAEPEQVATQANTGQIEARPRLSRWLLTAVFSCLILFCLMSFFITSSYTNNRQAVTMTVQAVNTERAVEATLTAAARTVEEMQTPRPTTPPTVTPIPLSTLTPAGS